MTSKVPASIYLLRHINRKSGTEHMARIKGVCVNKDTHWCDDLAVEQHCRETPDSCGRSHHRVH